MIPPPFESPVRDVTLDTVVGAFLQGASAESIADDYPAVSLADVYATIGYYLRHRDQIDEYLRGRERDAEQLKQQIEARPEHQQFRERLLARARQQGLRP